MAASPRETSRAARRRRARVQARGRRAPAEAPLSATYRDFDRYFDLDAGAPAPFSAAGAIGRALDAWRQATPDRGRTAGELAARFQPHFDRERRELAAADPAGSGSLTELRDATRTIKNLRPFHERASLLRTVQQINALRQKGKPQHQHRVRVCLRTMTRSGPTDETDGARVVEVVGAGDAPPRYRGVGVCGCGWVCPVCAPRITEARRLELREGVKAHRDAGGAVLLFSFTFSHGPGENLAERWRQLSAALQAFHRCATVKKFRKAFGWRGRIRAREITYGLNGWHPHAHTLELVDGAAATEQALDGWLDALEAAWQAACTRADLSCSREHGFHASLTDVDDYIAKWGIESELTKWTLKRGRIDPDAPAEARLFGLSPFDLLRVHAGELAADRRLRLTTDRAAALFAEYAEASAGTAQLHWSRGLKGELGLTERADRELAERDDPEEAVIGTLSAADWNAITAGGKQVEFLGLVHCGGWSAATLFLERWKRELEHWRRLTQHVTRRNRGIAYLFRGGGKKR